MVISGRIADKSSRWYWKNQLILFCVCELVIAVFRLFAKDTVSQWISYSLLIVFLFLMMPMVNLASFYYSSRGIEVNFGIARGIGSVVFAAVSFLTGRLIGLLGIFVLPVATAIFAAGMLAAVLLMPKADAEPVSNSDTFVLQSHHGKNFLRRYPVFLVMVTGIAFVLIFHNMFNTFFLRIMEKVGGEPHNMGIALAIAAASELPILFLYSRIMKKIRFSTSVFLFISSAFFVIRGILFLLAQSVLALYLIQLLQSLSYALMAAAKASYADEVMATEDATTGQSLMTMTDSIGAVAGGLLGGALVHNYGVNSMLLWGTLIAFVGSGIIGAALLRSKRRSCV